MSQITNKDRATVSRRGFLQATGGVAAGLIVGFGSIESAQAATAAKGASDAALNPFLRIAPDGTITVLSKHLDKGQGIVSGLATLVAEELDADWSAMRAEFAPANAKLYNNLFWGKAQGTGGSTGLPNSYMQYRKAGAAARAMLVSAAAKQWNVPAGEITIEAGVMKHASGKSAGFGEFAAAAANETPPQEPTLKTPDQFRFIGNPDHRRLDTASKTIGEATYTQDIQLPGTLVAVIARPPKFGATVATVNDTETRKIAGVEDVVISSRIWGAEATANAY